MTIEREVLERLLAERPGGARRSAHQAVKEGYAEISLMRELGVTWAEIADLLGRNGTVGRGGKLFTAATVRAAFFLVGAEIRQGQQIEAGTAAAVAAGGPDGSAENATTETPASTEPAPVAAGSGQESVEPPVGADPPADIDADDSAFEGQPDVDADSGPILASARANRLFGGKPVTVVRQNDMLLMAPARSKTAAWADADLVGALESAVPLDRSVAATTPGPVESAGVDGTMPRAESESQPPEGRLTPEGALTWDWTRRINSSAG